MARYKHIDTSPRFLAVDRLQRDARQLRDWLANHPDDRRGAKRKNRQASIRKSNRTDSANMANSKGVIQGYTGVSAVDAKQQIQSSVRRHTVRARSRSPCCRSWMKSSRFLLPIL